MMTRPLILQTLNLDTVCPPTQHLQHNPTQKHTISILSPITSSLQTFPPHQHLATFIHFNKFKSHAGIMAMNMLTLLPEIDHNLLWRCRHLHQNSWPWGNTFYNMYWQKNLKNTKSYKIIQTQPSHLPQGPCTYLITSEGVNWVHVWKSSFFDANRV